LAVFLVLCFGVATLGSVATTPNVRTWYLGLVKPGWTPPGWVFGPVWSILYFAMSIAGWLVWRQMGLRGAALPLTLFGVQLALNGTWSWLFFGLHSPGIAFVEIVLLWLAIAVTAAAFWRRSVVAGWLFVPYLVWVSFAAVLNFAVWRLNT
jgi:tryptophan-rich sensory protein